MGPGDTNDVRYSSTVKLNQNNFFMALCGSQPRVRFYRENNMPGGESVALAIRCEPSVVAAWCRWLAAIVPIRAQMGRGLKCVRSGASSGRPAAAGQIRRRCARQSITSTFWQCTSVFFLLGDDAL